MTPLVDLQNLYPTGNEIPPDHLQLGMTQSQLIRPRDAEGNIVPTNGKLVFAAIGGMSNANLEFRAFLARFRESYRYTRRITFYNGNRGGWDAYRIAVSEKNAYWQWFMDGLARRNISPKQVQVAWIKNSVRAQAKPFPEDAYELQNYLEMILFEAMSRFENLRMVFFSSAMWSGYNPKPVPRKEPQAYDEAYAVKWLVEEHLGSTNPWIAWGPYMWANGATPREYDGLYWLPTHYKTDMVHPNDLGQAVWADHLFRFFNTCPATADWFGE